VVLQGGGRDVEIPPPSEETCSVLLLLGLHAYHDPSLVSQLARLLTHMLLRSSVLLHSAATLQEGNRRLRLVRPPVEGFQKSVTLHAHGPPTCSCGALCFCPRPRRCRRAAGG
jgi:hypothetical protein